MTRHRAIALLLLAGCASGDSEPPTDTTPHVVLAPDLSIGAVSGDDALLFARVTGTAVGDDGRIYVADTEASEVRAFESDGTFRFRIGRQGAGPGEFDGLCCIAFDAGGRLWARDFGNARFLAFDVDGSGATVAHTVRMSTNDPGYWAAIRFTDGGLLVQAGHRVSEDGRIDQVLLHTDTTGAVLDSVRIPATPEDSLGLRIVPAANGGRFYLYPPYGPLDLIAHGPGGQYAKAVSSAYRIAWYDAQGTLLRVIARTGIIGPTLTGEERTRAEERVRSEAERFDLSSTDRARVPDRKQPLEALFFDDAGRLWVQPSTTPDQPNRADVYGIDGTLAMTVEWPAGITLSLPGRVTADAAIGIATDSLGVQRIVRMPLH